MPDLEPMYQIAGSLSLSVAYLWLLWTTTKDWTVRIVLSIFPVLPANLQTLVLGCILIWAIKDAKIARDAQEERLKRIPLGPRPV